MVTCGKCGGVSRDKSKFCNTCGNSLQPSSVGYLKIGTVLEERYEILSYVTLGDMSAIYKARAVKLGSICAVKELIPSAEETLEDRKKIVEWFNREAKLLARLDHASIPKVFDYFNRKGRYYLIMSFVEGENLYSILRRMGEPGLPEDIVIEWAEQVLSVLNYLHGLEPPIIYRDLKPENIMLHKDGRIMLIDFGIARIIRKEQIDNPRTVIGTDGYSPIEQYQGRAEPRSDIYALGATMHHLLTGKMPEPLSIDPIGELMPGISPRLEKIITKSLEEKPVDRFSNAREMLDALKLKKKIEEKVNFGVLYRDILFTKGLRAIYFADSLKGWGVGDNGIILYTSDGGNSWRNQKSGIFNCLFGVFFADPLNGWIVGDNGTILYTTDGGNIWRIVQTKLTVDFYGIYSIEPGNVWIVGDKGIVLNIVWPTSKHWVPAQGRSIDCTVHNTGTLSKLYSVYFIGSDKGWALGEDGIILHTENRGKSWAETKFAKTLMKIYFSEQNKGWAVGDYGTVLHSNNGGITWYEHLDESASYFMDIHFIDGNGWIVGGDLERGEVILHTTDGGDSWNPCHSGLSKPLIRVQFVNSSTGWILASDGTILHTSDEGKTWNKQKISG